MAVSRISSRGWLAWAAALLLASGASALDITGLSITTSGTTNTADGIQDTGNNRFQVASSTSVTLAPSGPVADTIGSLLQFQTRYASVVAQDREGGAAAGEQAATHEYIITFTVDNPGLATYQIDISTLRVGALTLVTDDAGTGSASIGSVSGTLDAIVEGALALAAVGPLAGSGGGTTAFSQSGSTLTVTSSAASQLYTLRFLWTSSATSTRDEAAIRMGIDGSMSSSTTAENYSLDGRSLTGDGHFVNVSATVIAAPEPAPAALISLGLIALALRGRRARR
jgi:hypothetical protein